MKDLSSRSAFRPVEEWKSALMTLPESGFFELLRSVFGNIKTPFNKQKLLGDLFIFLSRSEIQKTITAFISEQDHKVIAAVALLDEPVPGELESFFSGELTFTELHALLLNLEERLILYRYRRESSGGGFRDEKVLCLALNPVLEPVLVPFITDMRPLFPSFEADSQGERFDAARPAVEVDGKISDGRIIAALFAFFLSAGEPLRAENGTGFHEFRGLRKKVLDDGKKIFPLLDLDLAVKIFLCLGLFRSDGRGLIPCREKIADYRELSALERREYWAAGLYICLNEAEQGKKQNLSGGGRDGNANSNLAYNGSPGGTAFTGVFSHNGTQGSPYSFSRNQLRRISSFIHRFLSLLHPERRYPETTLRRLGKLLEREYRGTGNGWGSQLFDNGLQISFELFMAAIERTGLLEKSGACWKIDPVPAAGPDLLPASAQDAGRGAASQARRIVRGKKEPEKKAAEPVIAMDTAFSFILYPEISFTDALELGTFCAVKDQAAIKWKNGTTVCFELTRDSVVRGFDLGIKAADMLELLDRLAAGRIDSNLGWTLKDWEGRYEGVSLNQGIVLSLAEDRRYLAETRPLSSLIRRILAPGVYLLSSGDRAEAAAALRKAGIDIIAQPPSGLETETARSGSYRNSFPRPGFSGGAESLFFFSSFDLNGKGAGENTAAAEENAGSSESIKQKFRMVLEKMKITKPERDELAARIERRLVLSESQLEGASLRYEKLEARGIDYVGKTAIAKQAVSTGSLLEVSWPGPGGKIKRIVGLPQPLEKKEGDTILVIKPLSREEEGAADSGAADAGSMDANNTPGDTIRIPLGKISLLRRIKQSIFGG